MTTRVEARYQDGKLLLPKPLAIPNNTIVRLTIEADDNPDAARSAWLRVSEETLLSVWDNSADDAFNELLAE